MASPSSTVKRIGIMGGSFDPVHLGHLIVAQDAVEKLNLSELIFIPASTPPHKQHVHIQDASHRLNMLQLAIESNHKFSVSRQEIDRGGISYSIDTIKGLKHSQPASNLILVVGSDTLVDLHNWYRIDELLGLCEVASFMRPGMNIFEKITEEMKLPTNDKEKLLANLFETHLIDISSTEIRARASKGRGIQYLVSPEVESYIKEHGLYQDERKLWKKI